MGTSENNFWIWATPRKNHCRIWATQRHNPCWICATHRQNYCLSTAEIMHKRCYVNINVLKGFIIVAHVDKLNSHLINVVRFWQYRKSCRSCRLTFKVPISPPSTNFWPSNRYLDNLICHIANDVFNLFPFPKLFLVIKLYLSNFNPFMLTDN